MRPLLVLLMLLLAGCTTPDAGDAGRGGGGSGGDGDGDGDGAGEPAGGGGDRSDPEQDAERAGWERWRAARAACDVHPAVGFGAGDTGFLRRDDGDDAVSVLAKRLDAEPVQQNATTFLLGDLTAQWEGGGTRLRLRLEETPWDDNKTRHLLEPFLEGAEPWEHNPSLWVVRWHDGDRLVTYDVGGINPHHGGGGGGFLNGPLPDLDLVGLDAAWNGTRDYGACIEAQDWPWDWDAWEAGRAANDALLLGHQGHVLYGLRFHDGSHEWFLHVDAEAGTLYAT